ncbi:MAG: DNA polymerase, partial [Myxococcota bacterium]
MLGIDRAIQAEDLPMSMILQVHDELVFEVEDTFVGEAKELVRAKMEGVHPMRVPLKVDIGVGETWLLAK